MVPVDEQESLNRKEHLTRVSSLDELSWLPHPALTVLLSPEAVTRHPLLTGLALVLVNEIGTREYFLDEELLTTSLRKN